MSENRKIQTEREILQKDLDSIYIGNLNTVEDNLVLPAEGKYGSRFVWSTGESRFIDEKGKVNRPLHGMGNRKVTLKVTASYGADSLEKEFTATVLQEQKETLVVLVYGVKAAAKPGEYAVLPPVVAADCADGRKMTIPVSWETYEPLREEGTLKVKGHISGSGKEAEAEIAYSALTEEEPVPEEKVKFFPVTEVQLLEGTLYYEYQQYMTEYLLGCDDDQMLYNEKLFYPMSENLDTLEDMHANQHIPQIMGAMDLFAATGEARYWKIGRNFWEIVTGGHIYCIGGVGETEMFHRAHTSCEYLTEKAAESCASYNMLRLTGQIFAYTADGKMMDYYDNTLRNHILTSYSHSKDGGTTYFMPLGPGECKEYSTTENTCCHGTGMESRYRYMEHIYAYDAGNVYVNLLIDSRLSGEEKLEIRSLEGDRIRILCLKDMNKKLRIHIPGWAQKNFRVQVRETEQECILENGYYTVPGMCKEGDEIFLELPKTLTILENDSDGCFVNIAYGPYILAAISGEKEFLKAPELTEFHKTEKPLCFEAEGITFLPFAMVDLEPHHVYFRK